MTDSRTQPTDCDDEAAASFDGSGVAGRGFRLNAVGRFVLRIIA
jgi:hypothetical protein